MNATEQEKCDLVMKGGITSGVVYPRAVMTLGEKYRFCRIGGTSAGAIAAAVTAAAEYGRQKGKSQDLRRIEALVDDLKKPQFLRELFQPAPANRPLWSVVRAATDPVKPTERTAPSKRTQSRIRAERAIVALLHARPTEAFSGFALLLALIVAGAVGATTLETLPAVLSAVAAVALVVLVALAALGLAAWNLGRSGYAELKRTRYGFCPGARQDPAAQPALTDWLHEHIQACAGPGLDHPLTFADLESVGVELEMLTTDLSFGRPVRVRAELGAYEFDPRELIGCLPKPVIDYMVAVAERAKGSDERYVVPGAQLPILAATRFSLSFPGLLSAMPLYHDGARHLFSDGGISSNFPIHFFDSWFPGRPTFGLDLAELPDEPGAEPVVLPTDPTAPVRRRWGKVDGVVDFVVRIKDTMQNWRDTTQSELPGYRERICQIRLTRDEGGLNLDMDPETIERLVERGGIAGCKLRDKFDLDQHRWIRYLTSMRLLELGLQTMEERFEDGFDTELAAGMPRVDVFRDPFSREWCEPAGTATGALLAVASAWGTPTFLFDPKEGGPRPHPVMRIVPEA